MWCGYAPADRRSDASVATGRRAATAGRGDSWTRRRHSRRGVAPPYSSVVTGSEAVLHAPSARVRSRDGISTAHFLGSHLAIREVSYTRHTGERAKRYARLISFDSFHGRCTGLTRGKRPRGRFGYVADSTGLVTVFAGRDAVSIALVVRPNDKAPLTLDGARRLGRSGSRSRLGTVPRRRRR